MLKAIWRRLVCVLTHHWDRKMVCLELPDSIVTCRECNESWWERGPY